MDKIINEMNSFNENYVSWRSIATNNELTSPPVPTSAFNPPPLAQSSVSSIISEENQEISTTSELESILGKNPILSTLVPRPTAWMAVYPPGNNENEQKQPLVCLIEGYCGASDRPPTLMLGSDSIAPQVLEGLRQNGVCTLSVATVREHYVCGALHAMAAVKGECCGPAKSFQDAGLKVCFPSESLSSILDSLPVPAKDEHGSSGNECNPNYYRRPPAVDSSPVQMHCRLAMEVPLKKEDENDYSSTMILLQIDTYVIHGSVLRKQSTLNPMKAKSIQGNPDVRTITAKIDFLLVRPLASIGCGRFGIMNSIYHMTRPRPMNQTTSGEFSKRYSDFLAGKSLPWNTCELNEDTCGRLHWEDGSNWEVDDIVIADTLDDNAKGRKEEGDGDTVFYTYRKDDYCPLGYNPMKQIVCPRFIGWISTYEPKSLKKGDCPIPHISPYSFFIDVARGSRPMVAFAACPRTDEFDGSDDEGASSSSDDDEGEEVLHPRLASAYLKDAQRDAEATGVFCVNLCSRELAWAMNASAAPLGKELSEFRLMETGSDSSKSNATSKVTPTHARAPTVNAPLVNEAPLVMECRWVKTVKIPDIFKGDSMYSLVVGEVVNIHVKRTFLSKSGPHPLSLEKLKPVARLGYGQEYTIVSEYV